MTDLEDAWDNYPVADAPLAQILGNARRTRRRQITISAAGGLVAAGVATALVITLPSTGGSPTPSATSAKGVRLAAFQADLKPAASCDQLLNTYRDRGLSQVDANGWPGAGGYREIAPLAMAQRQVLDSAPSAQPNSSTGTNVQEVGVDEPDTVKTNGSLLVRIDSNTLAIYDVTGGEPRQVSTLALPYFGYGQILMSGTTVVALGVDTDPAHVQARYSRVVTVSLTDPAHPAITGDVVYSGAVTSARQHGSDIRLVISTGLPALAFVQPTDNSPAASARALEANKRIVSESTLAQWLPTVDTGNGPSQLLACDAVAITPDTTPPGTTSVIGFDASTPTKVSAIGLSGLTSIAYESSNHLYLTSNGTQMGPCNCLARATDSIVGPTSSNKTTIFQFDLSGVQAAHVATGTVDGAIKDRWSMDEVGGVLRVAITQTSAGKQSSSVVTLKQAGESLVQIGRLDGFGINETLTAARWFDTFAVISTAQQTDPLFSVDLTDPAHPKLLGALHIPGFSSYFHPLGDGLMLGIGQNVSFSRSGEQSQAQVALFDIADLTHVQRLTEISLAQWTYPIAGEDPRAFTWLPRHQVALTWFSSQSDGMILGEFTVANHALTHKLITVPAADPTTLRTMELPNGKVVMMAGGSVTFLPLP